MDQRDTKLKFVAGALVCGIDIAKVMHWARLFLPTGITATKACKFKNNRKGFQELLAQIRTTLQENGLERVVVAMEPTGPYWRPLAQFLMDEGIPVVIVNPYHAKRLKEHSDNTRSKSDIKDCRIIADLARDGNFMWPMWLHDAYAQLRQLTAARLEVRRGLVAAMARVQAWLAERFPEFPEVFKDPMGRAACWALEHCPLPSQVMGMSFEELVAGLQQASQGRVGVKRAARLLAAAKDSIGYREGAAGAEVRLQGYLQDLKHWAARLTALEEQMNRWLERTGLAEYLLSLPGVGMVTAAAFLGEIGDPKSYRNSKEVVKLAGANVAENSSGQHRGRSQLNKRGRPGLRLVIYLAAVQGVRHCPELQAFYRDLIERKTHPLRKPQALIAVGCKLMRMMWHVARYQERYDPGKVLGGERARKLETAA